MNDMLSGEVNLSAFRGVAFCGGFSYADTNGSAKGWAGVIKFHPILMKQFNAFYARADTFSLGVCNGCQLMSLLGWVPCFPDVSVVTSAPLSAAATTTALASEHQVRFMKNALGRFECRWSAVRVLPSPSALLRDMVGSVLGTNKK